MDTPQSKPPRPVSEFGRRVRQRMDQLGLSHAELAKRVSLHGVWCDRARVGKIVAGRSGGNVRVETARAFALALDVSPEWLLFGRSLGKSRRKQ